jgi:hypothetical protein
MLRLKAGTYRIDKPMQIGSMRLMGTRNLVIFSAVSAPYRNIRSLIVGHFLKKNLSAPTADIIDISATFHSGPYK